MIVIGPNSEVAEAFIEKTLSEGKRFPMVYLLSSTVEGAERLSAHLMAKYQQPAQVVALDLMKPFDAAALSSVDSDILFCAAGYLGNPPAEALQEVNNTQRIIGINYSGLVPVLNYFAGKMMEKRRGDMIVLSSVAGERGRMSNFIYGSAKAGLTAYLGGLRNLLHHHHVHVMTVKPGFMDTKMTAGMDLNPKLTATPAQAANYIYKAWQKKKNTIFVMPIWQFIMLIIRNIPEFIFKKLKM